MAQAIAAELLGNRGYVESAGMETATGMSPTCEAVQRGPNTVSRQDSQRH